MDAIRLGSLLPKKGGVIRLPPRLFQHEDLIQALGDARPIDRADLKNTLNHIHFMDKVAFVHLRHNEHEEGVLVKALPGPCLGKELTCRWSEEDLSGLDLEEYQFLHVVIDDGRSMLVVPAALEEINRSCLIVRLPNTSYALGQRQARRYRCHKIAVDLIQSGFQAKGELSDFSPTGFRVRVAHIASGSFHWFNSDALVNIHFRKDQQILFSGLCECIRQQDNLGDNEIVLVPADRKIQRFKRREIRNRRQALVPSPALVFDHPLLKRKIHLEVSDISTSGFSVYEKADEGTLMQGMIISELVIDFAGASGMKCSAQVIYRQDEKKDGIRCGLAILDMDINSYSRLAYLLTKALDPHAHLSNDVDMEDLWEFFFDTGFIYPSKYRLIQSHREDFKRTYRKLYKSCPEIARHFTYQKNGRIYAHMSMVRAYERTWMIHHHAARIMDSRRAGFLVLKQVMLYLNDMHRLPSTEMDYAMCYFRPDSKFPGRVFGGFAKALDNIRGCSMDLFSYLSFPRASIEAQLPDGWAIQEASNLDLWKLRRFYNHQSGGLLLDVLRLGHWPSSSESLGALFEKLGFVRRWKIYSLTLHGELYAVLIANQSDFGLNLSELLNGIKILVTKESLPWDVLSSAINELVPLYESYKVPVLIYPVEYVDGKGIPYEKQYRLWILSVQYGNEYMEFMQKKFRIGYK